MLASSFRIVFFGVFCVCRISIVFCSVWAISRLSAHAGFDLQFSFFSVRGDFSESSCAVWWCGAVVGGVGGVFSFCFLHLLVLFGGVVRCGRGGGVGGVGGVGGGADDVHANATCFFFLVSSSSCAVWWCGAVVGGGVGGWGGADDVHANATCFFFLFSSSSCAVWWCGAVVGGGVGGGLMTSMRMRLVFSFCFLHLLVLFGGAVRSWGGGGGGGG